MADTSVHPGQALFELLVNGNLQWKNLTIDQYSSILRWVGLDPNTARPSQINARLEEEAKKYLEFRPGKATGFMAEGIAAAAATGDGADPFGDGPPGDDDKKGKGIRVQREERDLEAVFRSTLASLGIGMSSNLRQLVQQAVNRRYNSTTFLYYLRKTPDYRQAFPGIFNKDGSLRMSEDTYLSYKSQFQDVAAQYGLNLGPGKIAALFRNEKTPGEFQAIAAGVSRLKRDPQLFQQFQRSLARDGIAGPKNKGDLLRFAMGQGNAEWYDHWNEAVARNAALDAGLKIKKSLGGGSPYAAIRADAIERLSKQGLSEEEITAGLTQVADDLTELLPLAAAQSNSITRKDILNATFGGKKASIARQKIERIRGQEEAFYEDRAGAGEEASVTGSSQRSGYKQRAQGA